MGELERAQGGSSMAQDPHILVTIGSALGRIEQRLTAIEVQLASRPSPLQWLRVEPMQLLKLAASVGVPAAVWWLTGSVDIALRFLSLH